MLSKRILRNGIGDTVPRPRTQPLVLPTWGGWGSVDNDSSVFLWVTTVTNRAFNHFLTSPSPLLGFPSRLITRFSPSIAQNLLKHFSSTCWPNLLLGKTIFSSLSSHQTLFLSATPLPIPSQWFFFFFPFSLMSIKFWT